ncbi:transcriptional regulator, partial [Streptomyces lasiicapitis]
MPNVAAPSASGETDYVVRLEQGRGLRPSAHVVEARALAVRRAPDGPGFRYKRAHQRAPAPDHPPP